MHGPEDRILDDEQYKQWKANETPAARRKRLTDHCAIWLQDRRRIRSFATARCFAPPPRAEAGPRSTN